MLKEKTKMQNSLIKEAKAVLKTLRAEHMNQEADVVSAMLADIESEYYRSSKPSDLKKGDTVVMHTCAEAFNPKYRGRIWVCRTDAFRHKGHDYDSIFLEGFSGSFSAEYLQKVNCTQMIEELGKVNRANVIMKEALKSVCLSSSDQNVIDCAGYALYDVKLIGMLKIGDKVKNRLTGFIGVIIDIQYEHDRYQFKNISGWMHGICDLELLEEVVEG